MAILDKTMVSAEISAETATECNLDLGAGLNSFWLLKIQITPDDAGYSTYTLYRDDTYAGDVAYEVDTNNLVPFYDPVHLDGESLSNEGPGVICQYVDEDDSHEFHLKIHNQALIARTYSVKIWYTEDFSDTLKTKLDGIAEGANVGITTTWAADVNASNYTLDNCETVQFNSEYDNGSKDDDFTITLNNGMKQKVTLTENTMTITLANPTSVGHWQVKIVNGGLATITWATSSGAMHWIGEVEPTLASDGYNLLMLYCDGTNIIGQATPDIGVAA